MSIFLLASNVLPADRLSIKEQQRKILLNMYWRDLLCSSVEGESTLRAYKQVMPPPREFQDPPRPPPPTGLPPPPAKLADPCFNTHKPRGVPSGKKIVSGEGSEERIDRAREIQRGLEKRMERRKSQYEVVVANHNQVRSPLNDESQSLL